MKPLFLHSPSGPLFAVFWSPVSREPNRAILHVPAFAEEMNKSRHMVALQAKILSEQGCAVLVLDLFGTGDSCGDFGDASWEHWLNDVAVGVAWLKRQGIVQVDLWSLRAGTLLAIDYVAHNPGEITGLLAWQPILNGDSFVTQFLRLRVAAAMLNSAAPQEKTVDLKRQIQQGQVLEVAGYALNPDLINPLMALKLDYAAMMSLKFVNVFEIILREGGAPSLVNQKFIEKLTETGVVGALNTVVGEMFWANQDITTAPALLAATQVNVMQWQ